jgi:hypothetical protein
MSDQNTDQPTNICKAIYVLSFFEKEEEHDICLVKN